MRIASFNVENLFDRAKVMNLATWAEGKPILEKFAQLSGLLGEMNYTAARKTRMARLMIDLGLEKSDQGRFVILRRNRGMLLRRPKTGGVEIVASGRADWAGSLELLEEPVDEEAMRNTARVINAVNADVLAVVETESRPQLSAFNQELLVALGGQMYRHVMVIDGNDSRGIDVGLLTRETFPIRTLRSHVDDCSADGERIFSRDCPEFEVVLPSGNLLWVLVNHLKSKGYGSTAANNARRRVQAQRVAEIYQALRDSGQNNIAVVGDLNDTPRSDPLQPLLQGSDLRDVSAFPAFDDGGYPGTFGLSNAGNKIDYILLSPALFPRITAAGVFRKGMWPGLRPKRWDVFGELTEEHHAASDHAALYVDLDL